MALAAGAPAAALAQEVHKSPPALPYGPPITQEQAQKVVAAVHAAAKVKNAPITFAIVDPAGELVYAERATEFDYAAMDLAIAKARSTARYRRPTSSFNDRVTHGDLTPQSLPGAFYAGYGGVLLIAGGRIIGAIGQTGGDQVMVEAGANVLK